MATLVAPLAQQYFKDYGYGGHMGNGWGWAMMALWMIIAVVVVVALVVWFIRNQNSSHMGAAGGPGVETPLQILDRRLAIGEITPEEYEQRAAILGKK